MAPRSSPKLILDVPDLGPSADPRGTWVTLPCQACDLQGLLPLTPGCPTQSIPQCPTRSSDRTRACLGDEAHPALSPEAVASGQGGSASIHPALGRGRRTTQPQRCCPSPSHSSERQGRVVGDDQGGDISPSTQGPGPRGQEQSNPRGTGGAAAEMGSVSRQARGERVTSDPWAGLPGWPQSCRSPLGVLWNGVIITPHIACPDVVSMAL